MTCQQNRFSEMCSKDRKIRRPPRYEGVKGVLSGLSRSECLKKGPKVFFVRAPAAGSSPNPFPTFGSPGALKIALPLRPYSFFGLLSCAGSHPKCPAAPPEAPNHGLRSSKCSGWSLQGIRDLILHPLEVIFEVTKPTLGVPEVI